MNFLWTTVSNSTKRVYKSIARILAELPQCCVFEITPRVPCLAPSLGAVVVTCGWTEQKRRSQRDFWLSLQWLITLIHLISLFRDQLCKHRWILAWVRQLLSALHVKSLNMLSKWLSDSFQNSEWWSDYQKVSQKDSHELQFSTRPLE